MFVPILSPMSHSLKPPMWFPWRGWAVFSKCKYQNVLSLRMELMIMFDVLSPQRLCPEQNKNNSLTSARTAEQCIRRCFGHVQHWGRSNTKTGPLHCGSLVQASRYDGEGLHTSVPSLSFVFIMFLRHFRCLHSDGSLSWIFPQSLCIFWGDGGELTFPGTIFNRAPPGVAREWLSQQLHWQPFSKVHLIYVI